MSALRLTPVPLATDEPSPGQAIPAAHLGIGYQGWITTELRLATFHRIDPSGSAIDRGGSGELLLTHPMGDRWLWSVAAAFVVAKRVRVGSTLDPDAPQFHDWMFPRRLSASIARHLGAGWRLHAHVFAEASDRDDPLLLSTPSPRFRSSLGGGIGLSWITLRGQSVIESSP